MIKNLNKLGREYNQDEANWFLFITIGVLFLALYGPLSIISETINYIQAGNIELINIILGVVGVFITTCISAFLVILIRILENNWNWKSKLAIGIYSVITLDIILIAIASLATVYIASCLLIILASVTIILFITSFVYFLNKS